MPVMLSKHRLHGQADANVAAAAGHTDRPAAPFHDALTALDAGALARLTELDPRGENRLIERVLQAFQTSVARLRPQAVAARANGDRATLRLVAHTLKSSSASIGAMHLSQLCAQVELSVRLGAEGDLTTQLDAMNAAIDAALESIATLLKERA